SATDVGRRRQNNQDMILDSDVIFAVADGMGGHQGGEVASLAAVEALREAFRRQPTLEGFERAIQEANSAVMNQAARGSAELRNMGTTLTALALITGGDDDLLAIANIGDSRAYLLRDGELSQLTDDHSVPQELFRQGQLTEDEAAVDPRRNILTRVLGPSFGDGPDMQNIVPFAGDRLLLCSDGLYNEVSDRDIAKVVRTVADPGEAARRLVELANANGGGDNISVVVVDVVDDDNRAGVASAALADEAAPARPPQARRPPGGLMTAEQRNAELRRLARHEPAPQPTAGARADPPPAVHELPSRRVTVRVVGFVLVLLLLFAGAGAAVWLYARGTYYVGVDQGQVAIFKGRPGGLLWFEPTIEERTSLPEASIPPARLDDVRAGHQVTSVSQARRYVSNLAAQSSSAEATAQTVPATTVAPPPPP
ncbi:MAG: protein phosphatase 2C domain-containing protein, partial [Actinobacteria bacterium]|nr:protein phosphatase 2C domain-containing protein [Actinomycetota bacterium]